MGLTTRTVLLGPIVLAGILILSPIVVQAQILGTFSGGDGPKITSIAIDGDLPVDPTASLWDKAPATEFKVMGQNITIPILFNPTVSSVNVRSVNNGTWIGWMLEWSDPSESFMALNTNQFRDAIAVVFPVTDAKTFIAMGGPGTPVNILHWKADWQKDVDMGRYLDRQDAYPNMAYDFYVGDKDLAAQGNGRFQGVEGGYNDPQNPRVPVEDVSKMYLPGYAAGNSFSTRDAPRQTPIEELVAEGFGTLTSQQHQDSFGKGMYDNGMWKVVIARSMLTEDPTDAQFHAGKNTDMAVAVWDGGNREVNGRKAVALWHTLAIEGGSGIPAGNGGGDGTTPGTTTGGGGGDGGGSGMLIPAIIIGVGAVVAAAIFYASRRKAAPTITK
ncbi:MAG: hypothetical protein HMLIMOIP_000098 [Candidatus Nitrosomirales archaeon]|jgi:hypothetical protein